MKTSPAAKAPLPATIWRTAKEKPTALTWSAVGASTLAGAAVGFKLAGSRRWEGAAFGAAVGFFISASAASYAVTGKVPSM